jgi:heme-degrading monooxygenase HmoA
MSGHENGGTKMIARVARFSFPSLQHREEAERNGSGRVGPSLAHQPGFQAIYFGRVAELEAFSVSLFDDRAAAEKAAATMNAEPLLPGQVPEMLPTPVSVAVYDVVEAIVHDRVPTVGRLGYLMQAPDADEASARRWAHSFAAMLGAVPGLCQAYLLSASEGGEQIALTFWTDSDAIESGAGAIGSWHAGQVTAGVRPAVVGTEAELMTDLRLAIANVPATMPVPA